MNASIFFTHSTFAAILVKWTVLLTLAWVAHWVVRFRHARLRLILWRSVLCFGLVLPITPFLPLPVLKIPVQRIPYSPSEISGTIATIPPGGTLQPPRLTAQSTRTSALKSLSREQVSYFAFQTLGKQVSWNAFFLSVWTLGFLWGSVRLLRFHLQLYRLRKAGSLPHSELRQ